MSQGINKKIEAILKKVDQIYDCLFGSLEHPGVIERVRVLESTRRSFFRIPNNVLIILQISQALLLIYFMFFKK